MNCSFWYNVLANFISDFAAGVIFGTLLAWWIGRKLSAFERGQQRKDEKRAQLEKAVRYLGFLKKEIDNLLVLMSGSIDRYRGTTPGAWARTIPTPFWDSLQPSGELPRLLDPDLLSSLTEFYSYIANSKRGTDLVLDSWSEPQPLDRTAFVEMILTGFEHALEMQDLPYKLDSGIQALKAELEAL